MARYNSYVTGIFRCGGKYPRVGGKTGPKVWEFYIEVKSQMNLNLFRQTFNGWHAYDMNY